MNIKFLPGLRTLRLCLAGLIVVFTACEKPVSVEGQEEAIVPDPGHAVAAEIWPKPVSALADDPSLDELVDNIFLQMSLEEKIGQVIQAEIQSITPEQAKKYHIGSILNGGGSMPYRIPNAKPAEWLKLADAFFEASMDTSDGKIAIPILWGTDAVHGHGNVTGATIFPHNIGLGAANNPQLIRRIGEITAAEVRATGIEWIFAPTVAVAQNDRWGRTYESYSEKPEIVAAYAKAMVEGMQGVPGTEEFLDDKHVIATAKHFVGDGGTTDGDDQGNVQGDEATLAAIHGAGYFTAVEAGVQTAMASFNSWNGEKVHGHKYLMNDVLKGKLGFEGFIVGDWNGHGQVPGCTNSSCLASMAAGLDMYMVPNDWEALYKNLLQQVQNGELGIARLNDAVKRILRVKARMGLFGSAKPSQRFYAKQKNVLGRKAHRDVARQAVRESLVLLKNKNNILPLRANQKIVVAGDAADDIGKQSGGWTIAWQGVTNTNEHFSDGTSIYGGLKSLVEKAGGSISLYDATSASASDADVAIVVYGEAPYAEGMGDINTLEYQAGNKRDLALLNRFKQAGIPVVSVFISGRPLWVNPELNASDAFVAAWLPGSEGGGVAEVLLRNAAGDVETDFAGRLSFSWPLLPTQARLNPHDDDYSPLFSYGYGLDYASAKTGPGDDLPEQVAGVAAPSDNIALYVGKPVEPWRVFIRVKNRRQTLSGGYAAMPESHVVLRTIDKEVQGDALHFSFEKAEEALLTIEDGPALDLSEIAALSFEVKVIKTPDSDVFLNINCGPNCLKSVNITNPIKSLASESWSEVRIPLHCFDSESASFKKVSWPFAMKSSGSGEFGVANIRLLKKVEKAASCPQSGG